MAGWLLLALIGAADSAPVFEADFGQRDGWRLDGRAEVTVTEDGALRLVAQSAMVYWAPPRLETPFELRFEARTDEAKCRAILFFLADGVDGRDLGEWERRGDYGEYAYDETMALYSVGLLRDATGTPSNLRRLGGELPERFQILRQKPNQLDEAGRQAWKQAFDDFQPYSIRSDAPDGTRLGVWHRHRIRAEGGRIRVWLDDRLVHDFTETQAPRLTRGRFGFRNFGAGTALLVRGLAVYRTEEEAP